MKPSRTSQSFATSCGSSPPTSTRAFSHWDYAAVSRLLIGARISAMVAANQRLWDTLYGLLRTGQRGVLDSLLTVPPGARVSELDRLRRAPVRISGPQMNWALEPAEEIAAFGMGDLDVSGIPPRRLAELSRHGVDGKASLLRRHGDSRRLATLLALRST